MNEQELFAKLKGGDEVALKSVYLNNQEKAINWALNNCRHNSGSPCTLADAQDLYQEAIIALYINTSTHRIQHLKVKFRTYLIAIMKNKWRETLRSTAPIVPVNFLIPDTGNEAEPEAQLKVRRVLKRMDEKCREMLTLRYFLSFDYEDIAEVMDYKNGATIRNLITRCRAGFREKFRHGALLN